MTRGIIFVWHFKTRPQEGGFDFFASFLLPFPFVLHVALALALFLHHLLVLVLYSAEEVRKLKFKITVCCFAYN